MSSFRKLLKFLYFTRIAPLRFFPGSEEYWRKRYRLGRGSGEGSYNKFASFKADFINKFVNDNRVANVIEFGCGDGNQLQFLNCPQYLGFDISEDALALCKKKFSGDDTKSFRIMNSYNQEMADLSLSLDVIYHLVEVDVFAGYMSRLFESAQKFVIIYSSNTNQQHRVQAAHVRHWNFSAWVDQNKPEWSLIAMIPNKYPFLGDEREGSLADFYIYEKK